MSFAFEAILSKNSVSTIFGYVGVIAALAVALADSRVEKVQVTVRKRPPVQGLEIVGVQLIRSRADQAE